MPKESCSLCRISEMARVRYVNAYPAAVKSFGCGDGCATTAEGVQHYVALVAAGVDDALQQGFGLLGRIAEAFPGVCTYGLDITNYVLYWDARIFVSVPFLLRY